MSDDAVAAQATAARSASVTLGQLARGRKDEALHAMADALARAEAAVLAANALDVQAAEAEGTPPALIDRLRLTPDRLAGMVSGLRDLARLEDPVGDVVRGWTTTGGIEIRQVRVPLGVVGIIYEARPNVTADAAGIAIKSGNAVLLRGSSSAEQSNAAVVQALRTGLADSGLPADAVQLVTGPRAVTKELMTARGLIDVLIPRGGAGLIETVVTQSTVPVIETGTGNCHLYVHADADPAVALDLIVNAKTQRPSVCNALETVLVDAAIAEAFLPRLLQTLAEHGVRVHGDAAVLARADADDAPAGVVAATDTDWADEYLSLDVAVGVVDDLEAALRHIRRWTSGHSETIVTESQSAARRFTAEVDAAAVLVNVSSRFVDGGEFGFGAEIGISTQKLHARGPMALPEMTSTKYVLVGTGQTRG